MATRLEISMVGPPASPDERCPPISHRERVSDALPGGRMFRSAVLKKHARRLARHLEHERSTPRMGISDVHPGLFYTACFLLSKERSWTGERTLSDGEEQWWTEP